MSFIAAAVIGGTLGLAGSAMGASATNKASKRSDAFNRMQLQKELERREKLLGKADQFTNEALKQHRKAANYDDLFAAGSKYQDRLSRANEARIDFMDDLLTGDQLASRYASYTPLSESILSTGLAERDAIEEAYAEAARARNMRNMRLGGGGFASDVFAARDRASNQTSANLAFAQAVERDRQNRFNMREEDLLRREAGATRMDDIMQRAALFDVMPQQLAFSTDLANMKDAYSVANTRMAPYALYAGQPQTNYQLSATGVSPMGKALETGSNMIGDWMALQTYKQMRTPPPAVTPPPVTMPDAFTSADINPGF